MTTEEFDSGLYGVAKPGELDSYRALIKRLPITVRPALNGQLASWATLFPFERRRFLVFMRGIASLDSQHFDEVVTPLRRIENRMGVQSWNFSQDADTMENASLLARSAEYLEWRKEVQNFYVAVEAAANSSNKALSPLPRIIVTILPNSLPYEQATVWKKWNNAGLAVSIEGDPARITEILLTENSAVHHLPAQQGSLNSSDLWLIDAASGLPAKQGPSAILNCAALIPLRDRVLAQVNTVPKSIEVTDQTLAAIRTRNWDPWWPPEIKDDAALHKFVIDVYLSGNGALIFPSAFVEWASSEAIRRARPRALFARFGMRTKPKAFTSIAIFENQQRISTLPDVDDPQGSALDAVVLAKYVFLSAQRYPESEQTAFLCIAESVKSAYLVLPDALKANWKRGASATPEQIAQFLSDHLSTVPPDQG